ncbi:DUF7344 domain-containing protein [Halogeometricum limi]|uniref:DUF7344 domain-containing protein n=1 Tax=Halogeometricum limi TaxID=555875 RepID=A0A1I6IE96_9EURY|nr:hypothetical protein [Halogeometricum limi]SFR65021.1 hypothetical protein SAMN04488124_3131 [Halogeometricum limi]
MFDCLADARRRRLVDIFEKGTGSKTVEELARELAEREDRPTAEKDVDDAAADIATMLRHVHLPKLNDAGVFDVDRPSRTVRRGDRFDVATALLEQV